MKHAPMPNLLASIEAASGPLKSALDAIVAAAQRQGASLWLVGGVVRDALRRKDACDTKSKDRDLDLAVVGDVARLLEAAQKEVGGTIKLAARFGTARWELNAGSIDVARARRETYANPGALPHVTFADTIQEDLVRRDFALNAMALGLTPPNRGVLLDPGHGASDAHEGVLRILHPQSFADDPTRLWRAARLCARLNLKLSLETEEKIAEETTPHLQNLVSPQRLAAELRLGLEDTKPDLFLAWLAHHHLLVPLGLRPEHTQSCLAAASEAVRLFRTAPAWLEGIDTLGIALAGLVDRWCEKKSRLKAVLRGSGLMRTHAHKLQSIDTLLQKGNDAAQEQSELAQTMEKLTPQERLLTWICHPDGETRRALMQWAIKGRLVVCGVTSAMLLEHGVTPGPAIRRAMQAARRAAHQGLSADAQLTAALRAL